MTEGVRRSGTYKTLAERREALTPAEQKFREGAADDRALPRAYRIPDDLAIVYWLSEAIPTPATAILPPALAVVLVKLLSGVCWRAA